MLFVIGRVKSVRNPIHKNCCLARNKHCLLPLLHEPPLNELRVSGVCLPDYPRDKLHLVALLVVDQLAGQELHLVLVVDHDVSVEEHGPRLPGLHHLPVQEHGLPCLGGDGLARHEHLLLQDLAHLAGDEEQRLAGGAAQHLARHEPRLLAHVHQRAADEPGPDLRVHGHTRHELGPVRRADRLPLHEERPPAGLPHLALGEHKLPVLLFDNLTQNKPGRGLSVHLKIDSG